MAIKFFNALNGKELRELILHDIKNTMERDDYFGDGLAFPQLKYKIRMLIEAYPVAQPTKRITVEGATPDPPSEVPLGEPDVIPLEIEREVVVPDLARKELERAEGLAEETTTPDKPIVRRKPSRNEVR